MSTEASVYRTPDSGSTWFLIVVGSTASELHWKYTLRAWATRQWRVAGLDLIKNVSEGSLRKMGSAPSPPEEGGSIFSGNNNFFLLLFWLEIFDPVSPKGGGGGDDDTSKELLLVGTSEMFGTNEESSFGSISLRSSVKKKNI